MTPEQAKHYATNLCLSALRKLEPHFKDEMRLTIICRLPGDNEADIMLSSDTDEEIIQLIQRRAAAEAARTKP